MIADNIDRPSLVFFKDNDELKNFYKYMNYEKEDENRRIVMIQ